MIDYITLKHLHLLTIIISMGLFVLRFLWTVRGSAIATKRGIKIAQHISDTLLLTSGVMLVLMAHYYPFSPQATWLTEKLFGVIIYILFGHIALSKRTGNQNIRWIAFILATGCLYLIAKLAITKSPLLMGYL